MKLDCHIHSHLSPDSPMRPHTILKLARRRGLDGVVIANHNRALPPEVLHLFADSPVFLVPAVEYSTDAGHVVALFWTGDAEALGLTRREGVFDHREILDLVHGAGGVCILAHPFGGDRTPDEALLSKFDGVEAANSRVGYRRRGQANILAREAAKTARLYTAGSDAHLPWEIGRSFVTLPISPPYTQGAILEALAHRPPVCSRPTHPCTLSVSQLYKGLRTKSPRLVLKSCATLVGRLALVLPGLFGIKPYHRKDD